MDWHLLITSFVTLVVILDPVGNAPVYLTLTWEEEPRGRRRFADQAVLAATVVIFAFAFFGNYILSYLGISLQSLMVAGGVLLGIVALDMMRGKVATNDALHGTNVAFVPLGTPLLAGPGALVAAMLLVGNAGSNADKAVASLGILAALLVVWVALRAATTLTRVLRETGVDLLTRLLGILLAAIAVEFIHQAVVDWIG